MTENSSTLCLDASTILKVILQPSDDPVQSLWASWHAENCRMVAPTLLYYEITNALYQQEKYALRTAEFVSGALDFVFSLPIQLIGDEALHQRARELAVQYKLPATYDAHYLALAERLNIELWTADARLYNAVQAQGVEWVKLVQKT